MNEMTGDFVAQENNSVDSEWSKNFSERQLNPQFPLLPRSAGQNQRAFLIVLIKAQQALEMAEITATLWD